MKTASKRRPRRGCRAGERRGRPGQGSTGRRIRRSRRRYLRHVPALRRHGGRQAHRERRGLGMADLRLSEWPRYENVARHGPDVSRRFLRQGLLEVGEIGRNPRCHMSVTPSNWMENRPGCSPIRHDASFIPARGVARGRSQPARTDRSRMPRLRTDAGWNLR